MAVALCGLGACRKEAPADAQPAASAARTAKPVDRLAPGELEAGAAEVFGLRLPRGMFVEGKFREFASASGRMPAEAVTNYVRDNVAAEHVEIGAGRTVFPSARIKAGAPDRHYRIEVLKDGLTTRLVIRDVTATAPPKVQGLSTEELWRRAGFSRDGKPLDPKALE